MTRLLLAALLLGAWALGANGSALAQYPYNQPLTNPYQRPILSPYLNLLRPGNLAVNYYGLVRPEQQLYNSVNQLQQQIGTNQQTIAGLQQDLAAPVTTGHPIYFMNYQRYFLNFGAQTPGRTGALRQPALGTQFRPSGFAASPGTRPGLSLPGPRGY